MEEHKVINENAKYIALNQNNHTILVDMYDIDDILPIQEIIFNGTNKKIMLYSVMFNDNTFWQVPIEDETIEIFKNFKNQLDKQK